MKLLRLLGTFTLLAFAAAPKLWTDTVERLRTRPGLITDETSHAVQLVPDSIHDGDTFRVTDGIREIKIRLCGIDAPELEQPLGISSRDHLRSLVARGNGTANIVKTATDQYGRTVAEVFVPIAGSEEEIHLNSQMVVDGMAYVYPQYVGSCPNASVIRAVEEKATKQGVGLWSDRSRQKPWEYRRQG